MSIEVIGTSWLVSDVTCHQAKNVGDGHWVVSYLPGRTFTLAQSVAALRIAENAQLALESIAPFAAEIGLGALAAFTLAASRCDWPQPTQRRPRGIRIRLRVK